MVKRKQSAEKEPARTENIEGTSGSDSDDQASIVNVEFEWFDPQPEHDFHGLKTLLRQLFDVDAEIFDLSALTDLILAQPLLGSTVKVEGNESDPFAFLTVLNLHEHRDVPVIQRLRSYLYEKVSEAAPSTRLRRLLSPSSPAQVGLILTERLINLPAEVVPPMYNMLLEEVQWAVEEREPYHFSDYIVISKTYREVEPVADHEISQPSKRSKKSKGANSNSELFYFHPEDEVLQKHAVEHGSFPYSRKEAESTPDSKRAFLEVGIRPQGHVYLIEASALELAVQDMTQYLHPR